MKPSTKFFPAFQKRSIQQVQHEKITDTEIVAVLATAVAEPYEPISVLEIDLVLSESDLVDLEINVSLGSGQAFLAFDPSTPPRPEYPNLVPASTGTRKISIRIPARVLAALKTRAASVGTPYQKLINRVLRDAICGWGDV